MRNRMIMKMGLMTLSLLFAVALGSNAQTSGEEAPSAKDLQKIEKKRFKKRTADEQSPRRLRERERQRPERLRERRRSERIGNRQRSERIGNRQRSERFGEPQRVERLRERFHRRGRIMMEEASRVPGERSERREFRKRHTDRINLHPRAMQAVDERGQGLVRGEEFEHHMKRKCQCERCREELKNRNPSEDGPVKRRAERLRRKNGERIECPLRHGRGNPRKLETDPRSGATRIDIRKKEVTRIRRELDRELDS